MADITNDLIYELLKKMQMDLSNPKFEMSSVKSELGNIRDTMIVIQRDVNNIYATLGRHETRLDRIENRLELRELAEAQARFEPHP